MWFFESFADKDPLPGTNLILITNPGPLGGNWNSLSVGAPPRVFLYHHKLVKHSTAKVLESGRFYQRYRWKGMGVSKNRGTPKWMVYNGKPENPIKMDDLGVPLFLETPESTFPSSLFSDTFFFPGKI